MAAKFASGNFLVAIVGACSAMIYARWIEPEVLGEINKYGILTSYMGVGIVVVNAAYQRHFQHFIVNEKEKALEIAASAKWWFDFILILGCCVFLVLSTRELLNVNLRGTVGWLIQIPIYGLSVSGAFYGVLYRTNKDFLRLNQGLYYATGAGVLLLPFLYLFGFFGLSLRKFVQASINLYYLKKKAPFKIRAAFSLSQLKSFARISLPLNLPSYFDGFFLKGTVAFFVLNELGEFDLGIYSMAVTFNGFILNIGRSLVQIVNTKLNLEYGRTSDFRRTFIYGLRPVLLLSGLIILVLVISFISLPFLVEAFLPNYKAAVAVFNILSLEVIITLLGSPFTLFVASLEYKKLTALKISKIILTLTLLMLFHNSLIVISLVLIIGKLYYLFGGYILMMLKLKSLQIGG